MPPGQMDGPLEILYPRWIYPPSGGALTALCLFVELVVPLARLRKRFPFQFIDAHFGYPEGIAAALLALVFRCPYSITMRGNETMHAGYLFRGIAQRWAIRRADRIITVSKRLREFAITCGAHPSTIRTIPNGVDSSIFYPRRSGDARRRLGLDPSAPLIVSAGYLIERKGHHKVIRALKALRERGSSVRLAIAGGPGAEGQFEPALRKLTFELALEDRVHFLGHLPPDDLAELMSAADVVCLASSREGWPNVVNESLACGTPVVATDIGGVPDMIPSANYGFIVPVEDMAALTQALDRALNKRWNREAISAWGMSRSWDEVAGEVFRSMQDGLRAWEKSRLK